jgi:hypothetical protein
MAKETPKPKGMGKFKSLLRQVVSVPKADVDAAIKAGKRKRRKK